MDVFHLSLFIVCGFVYVYLLRNLLRFTVFFVVFISVLFSLFLFFPFSFYRPSLCITCSFSSLTLYPLGLFLRTLRSLCVIRVKKISLTHVKYRWTSPFYTCSVIHRGRGKFEGFVFLSTLAAIYIYMYITCRNIKTEYIVAVGQTPV